MILNRKETLELYNSAKCAGEWALFSSTNRASFELASTRCAECPVISSCLTHVNPAVDGFTGTCAGRLWYEGVDVTDDPDALPPPVFRESETDVLSVELMLTDANFPWTGYTDSTLMAACWSLRRTGTLNRVAKRAKLSKERAAKLIQVFEEDSEPELRDFIASMTS